MVKDVTLKALFIGFAAVLIVGAINRTSAINEKVRSNEDDHAVTEESRPSALAWQSYEGVVAGVSETGLVIETTDGTEIQVEGRPWLYIEEQGFIVAVGDNLSLTAFTENGEYQVGELVNRTNGHSIQVRDSQGIPAWRGRGQD